MTDDTGDTDDTRDVVALWRLQSAYADVVTRRAWDELHGLFLPSTTVEVDTVTSPVRSFTGPADFGAFVAAAIERFDHFAFVILNTVVDVDPDGDTGVGRIFMCEIRHDAVTGDWSTAYGLYQDDYRRRDGRWWFAERRYRSLARTGPTAAVLGVPPGLPPIPPLP